MLFQPYDRFMHQGWWWPGMLFGLVLFFVVVGVAIWAVVRLTSKPAAAPQAATPQVVPALARDSALEEVRVRYARGEIDRDEFVQRSRDLGGPVPGPGPGDVATGSDPRPDAPAPPEAPGQGQA